MVRLKDLRHCLNVINAFSFNSTMVRLKGDCVYAGGGSNSFQFHYGSIKSTVYSVAGYTRDSFNSTMVRLKDLELEIH